jgi:tetratricopeptide (TPR) repeat protein
MTKIISILFILFFFKITIADASEGMFNSTIVLYSQGKYQAVIEELTRLENKIKNDPKTSGLISYWKGMVYNRTQEFPAAIGEFKKSLSFQYVPDDIHYEYGQALFASENLVSAKIQFSESFKRSFKRAASLYYMAFISKQLEQQENAKTLWRSIIKLADTDPDVLEVKQASQMQLSDMELEEAEKKTDVFRVIENRVIPSYQEAKKMAPTSHLAEKINEKIIKLQKKYELVLFQLRNGRPTLIPPYFIRAAQEFGIDSNVTFSPTETVISKSKQSSIFSKTEFIGRYTFYFKNYLSYSPELRLNNTYYFNRVPEIYRNDNYLLAPSLRMAYEHKAWGNPAALLVDFEFTEAQRDVNAKQELDFSSRSQAIMLGEKFKYWSFGETVVRFKERFFESYLSGSDSQTTSLIVEQVVGLKSSTLLFYTALDRTRVRNELFDTNAILFRGDWLLPKYKDWFTPSLGMAVTVTDPINNRSERGTESLLNPNIRIYRNIGKNWKLNSRFEYYRNNSKDQKNFDYKKNLFGMELEYLF